MDNLAFNGSERLRGRDSGFSLPKPNGARSSDHLIIAGWQEWVALPEFGIDRLHAKLDTGASMSSLHAIDIHTVKVGRDEHVRFRVVQEDSQESESPLCEAKLIAYRNIRSSSGHVDTRPVIETMLYIAGYQWPIDLTLSSRTGLEFRLLIGRSAIADRCLVDSSRANLVSR